MKSALATLLIFATFAFARPQQLPPQTSWTPPPSRKAKMIFAPKPFGGDNIFKGEAEVWLADAVEKLEGDVADPLGDQAITEYVTKVGNHVAAYSVAPGRRYQFIITTDWSANAMTAGGGRIYITRGMLRDIESEDELAGVLAHEIAHDAFSHAAKAVTRQMFWLTGTRKVKDSAAVEAALQKLLDEFKKQPLAAITETVLGFSRFAELEADRAAFYNIYKAGYNPRALKTLLARMAHEEKEEVGTGLYYTAEFLTLLFGSHPPSTQRTTALSWESNFVKMPPKESRHDTPAFAEMKARIQAM